MRQLLKLDYIKAAREGKLIRRSDILKNELYRKAILVNVQGSVIRRNDIFDLAIDKDAAHDYFSYGGNEYELVWRRNRGRIA